MPDYVPCSSIPLRAISNLSHEPDTHVKLLSKCSATPNPFSNEPVRIAVFEMGKADIREIQITDITGRNVTALFEIRNIDETGFQIKPNNTDQLAPGLYLCSFGNKNSINRLKLLKR